MNNSNNQKNKNKNYNNYHNNIHTFTHTHTHAHIHKVICKAPCQEARGLAAGSGRRSGRYGTRSGPFFTTTGEWFNGGQKLLEKAWSAVAISLTYTPLCSPPNILFSKPSVHIGSSRRRSQPATRDSGCLPGGVYSRIRDSPGPRPTI